MLKFKKRQFPPQHQDRRPGIESEMDPKPIFKREFGIGCDKLKGKVAIITGGDSGIGRAVAVAFSQEGADVCIIYLNEHNDAEYTKSQVEENGRRCLLISGDVSNEEFCKEAVQRTVEAFEHLDILVNCAGEIYLKENIEDISQMQIEKTFKTNVFSIFYMVKAAIKHLPAGSSIINTTSITAYRGNGELLDYSSSKGAITSLTRSLSHNLLPKGIRVNGVAPGPIWTPFIPSYMSSDMVSHFGDDTPMERAGQPVEVAPCYVFLASEDASYMSGQILHPNGGEVING